MIKLRTYLPKNLIFAAQIASQQVIEEMDICYLVVVGPCM